VRPTSFIVIALLLVLAPAARGGEGGEGAAAEACREGVARFEAREFEAAYAALSKAFREAPADLETNFMLGRAAFETGRYHEAVMAFERVLLARPEAARVKLELARCYVRLKAYATAQRHLDDVLAAAPPPQVRRNIETLKAQIDAATKPGLLTGKVSLGYHWDSNVYLSPADDTIRTELGDRILTPGEREQRDTYASATVILDHKARLGEGGGLWWKTSVLSYNAFYSHRDDLDLNYCSVMTGPALETERWALELRGLGSYVEEGYDRYLASYGLAALALRAVNDHVVLAMGAKAEDLKYYPSADEGLSGPNLSAHIGPVFIWGKHRVTTRLAFDHQNADDDVWSYDRARALVRYERPLPLDATLLLGYRFEHALYEEPDPEFARRRRDSYHAFSVAVSRKLWGDLSAELSHTYAHNSSALDLYDYDRHLTSLLLSLRF